MPDEKIKVFFPEPQPGRNLNTLGHLLLDEGRRLRSDIWRYLNAYEVLLGEGPRRWERATLQGADVVVDPHWLFAKAEEQSRVDGIVRLAAEHGKPCLFFQNSDFGLPCEIASGTVYRTSVFRSRRKSNEEAMVAESDDMLFEEQGGVPLRPWTETPTISFCGNVSTIGDEVLMLLARKFSNIVGTRLRRRTIRQLERCQAVRASIIARRRFWGGTTRPKAGQQERDVAGQRALRQEYKQNMFDSDYVLCLRGAGNFSYRFYETLSAGRIPLLIDTDCLLPFADEIDWPRHCCIVPAGRIADVEGLLLAYHRGFSPEEYLQRQAENRQLWLSYCEVFAFYHRVLSKAAGRKLPAVAGTAIEGSPAE